MQSSPQIIVFAIGTAEKRPEAVELDALQRRLGAALADGDGVVWRNAVDADWIELVHALALEQRQGRDVEERETQMREQHRPAQLLRQRAEPVGQAGIGGGVERT